MTQFWSASEISNFEHVLDFWQYYIDRSPLVALVKYILSEICNAVFLKEIFLKSSEIYFFYPKTSNFHDPGIVGRKKLPDPSINNTLTWFWHEVPCYNNTKRSILTSENYNLLFKPADDNWIIIMEQKIKI